MKLKTFTFPDGQIAYGTEHIDIKIDGVTPEVTLTEYPENELHKFFRDPTKRPDLPFKKPHPPHPLKK